MQPRRMARVNELIQQTVSRLMPSLKDPGLGFITITEASVSSDLSLAKIYYSVLGSMEERESTAEALERAKPFIRSELAKLESMRKVPHLLFIFDQGVEKADRVNRLLHKIQEEQQSSGS